jgi:glutathione S-transferase
LQLKLIDLEGNEHLTREFLAINPLHQVPTLDDNGFYVADSHAIIQYLAAGTTLTSIDPHVLARINQAMFFDFELFRVMGEIGVS